MRAIMLLTVLMMTTLSVCMAQVCGCTDPLATNYNPEATVNDGGCIYASTTIEPTVVDTLDAMLEGSSSLIFWNNGYWTWNDHGDSCLYRIDTTDASILESLCINGIDNYDMEEISQDSLYLYLGDVGNNNGFRQDLHILRVSKDSLLAGIIEMDTIWFSYEDQTDFSYHPQATDFDCEAFIVTEDSIYLFTKQWVSMQTTLYVLPKTPGTHIAQRRETYPVNGLITGATYVPEYRLVTLCGYEFDMANYASALHPFLILLYDFQDHNFFSGNKRRLDFNTSTRAQVEAIATHNTLDFYVTNEYFTTTLGNTTLELPALLRRLDLRDFLLPYLSGYGVSVHDNIPPKWLVYPNPATDRLYVDYPEEFFGANYEILSLNGQRVAEGVLTECFVSLSDRNMTAGEYVLVIRKNKKIKTFSFIKQVY